MSDNLDTLRKVAEAATQGVWERFDVTDLDTFGVTDLAHVLATELETEDAVQAVATGVTREDAHHIATFNPPAVLALLSRLEQAEQAVVLAKAECARQREHKGVFARRAAEAEQRVARVWEVATGDPIEYGWSEAMFAVLRALGGEQDG